MANLPTDMELELALSQRNSTRTPSPQPQFTPCEQLKFNKAQLAKMETFRKCKQEGVIRETGPPATPLLVTSREEMEEVRPNPVTPANRFNTVSIYLGNMKRKRNRDVSFSVCLPEREGRFFSNNHFGRISTARNKASDVISL
ncbi:hypothetical protein TNIN_148361 [Trichonephila inaurata madagascariensis]|uniref:Uncharacterized protein n=1 Tax=Trichonephila inaurata madagascariensis TaxID=2747483 RepID=A0A8X6YST2_9ARAC|nr:hypothetical protein TNIN_148361 [Trichonephila inaurata madagascariensis]